jgi:hypothetical protein
MSSISAPSAVSSALGGINAASRRLDASAAKVAFQSFQGDTVAVSDAARQAPSAGSGAGNLASAMVDLRVAKYQAAASVAVLRTANDVSRDVLRIGSCNQS